MIRSLLAVLAGIAALTIPMFAIEAAADAAMMRLFPAALPNHAAIVHNVWAALFSYTYQVLCIALGGYVTAAVARRAPVRHALIMGVLQAALVIPAMFAYPNQAPLHKWLIGMALILPAAWCGGAIRAQLQKPERAVTPSV